MELDHYHSYMLLYCINSVYTKITVFWDVTPCSMEMITDIQRNVVAQYSG
jgi:hypothetical protein